MKTAVIIILVVALVIFSILLILHVVRLISLLKDKNNKNKLEEAKNREDTFDLDGTIIEIQEKQIIIMISDDCWQHVHAEKIAVDYDKHNMQFDAQIGDFVTVLYSGDIKENTSHLPGIIYQISKKEN